MPTPFQVILNNFSSIMDEDLLGQEEQIFEWFKTAIPSVKKSVNNTLGYKVYTNKVGIYLYTSDDTLLESGNIKLKLNNDEYIISLTENMTLLEIANVIKTSILSVNYDVEILNYNYRILIEITDKINDVLNVSLDDIGSANLLYYFIEQYDGEIEDELEYDVIQLLANYMKLYNKQKKLAFYSGLKRDIGTKDFNKLPNKKQEMEAVKIEIKQIKSEISDLRNELYEY